MAILDVITLAEAKARLGGNVAITSDDSAISDDITALSALFDDRFGAVVQREVTEVVSKRYPESPSFPRTRLYVNGFTSSWPIVGTPTSDVGTVAVTNGMFGRIELSTSAAGTVTYTAGRFATTGDVSEQFKSAFIVALRNWRQADHVAPFIPAGPDYPTPRTAFPKFAMPNAVDQMLSKFKRYEGIA